MKTYQKPEIEMITFATENITVEADLGAGGSNGNEWEEG